MPKESNPNGIPAGAETEVDNIVNKFVGYLRREHRKELLGIFIRHEFEIAGGFAHVKVFAGNNKIASFNFPIGQGAQISPVHIYRSNLSSKFRKIIEKK